MNVKEFYNKLSAEYSDLLDKAIPRYREMLATMLHYLPNQFKPLQILDLGCGTGNLTDLLVKTYPFAELVVVDLSDKILEECKVRFQFNAAITYHQADFKEIEFRTNSFDLIVSSIAIHHINDADKKDLFQKIYSFLKPGGIFTYADQCKGINQEIYQKNIDSWKVEALKLGSTEENWDTWMKHQEDHDFHTTLKNQLRWLEMAGFINIEVLWRNLLWTSFYAEKEA